MADDAAAKKKATDDAEAAAAAAALAWPTEGGRRVLLASRKTSSSSARSSAKTRPFLCLAVLLLLILVVTAVFLFPPAIMSSSSSSAAAAASVPFQSPRKVVKKVLSLSQSEGQGATVRRSIGGHEVRNLDPFLLLDEFSVSKPGGFPDHPHRGFETVTYMLDGVFTHQDFSGHTGTIRTGDVQWMTAGRGIVHSEMPAADGVQKGLQLWINLASKDKMIEPRYQELESKDISQAEKDGVAVRIIAGEAFGVRSPVYTRTPTMYMDFTMQPGSQLHQPIPEGWNAVVYIIEGEGVFAGQPLNEPVVQQGPFVMNSRAQIQQAMEDYYYGRNGFEKASQWSSA
ncbi:unnamed protein product [Triticum turgidum subsp. durum]|uniref:Pirin n=1 Tax=Triticum turgidum subsp. durum TaxID=4567 RepID=A0A9R0SKD8_TRITD|nr:unnamed protein product [Triticum turgidum subsp. durum]